MRPLFAIIARPTLFLPRVPGVIRSVRAFRLRRLWQQAPVAAQTRQTLSLERATDSDTQHSEDLEILASALRPTYPLATDTSFDELLRSIGESNRRSD